MPKSYSEIYFHAVFACKYRQALLDASWRKRVHEYIWKKIVELEGSPIAIGGTADHVHVFWRHTRTRPVSEFMNRIKGASSRFINHHELTEARFSWQGGYGIFSVSRFRVQLVKSYILRQEEIHRKRTLQQEYKRMLLKEQAGNPEDYQFAPLQDTHPKAA